MRMRREEEFYFRDDVPRRWRNDGSRREEEEEKGGGGRGCVLVDTTSRMSFCSCGSSRLSRPRNPRRRPRRRIKSPPPLAV